jgi:hypothetical protein
MPNPIKYSTSAQTLALKKGNFWIGTGDVGKGPTSTTDYYNGITPPSGGYTIYLNKASGGPSIYTAANDSQLISLSNTIAGQTFATAAAALDWYNSQSDKMVFNRDYEAIVTNGLVLNLDGAFTPSYPTTGAILYDISGNNYSGNLVNGPTVNSLGVTLDGTNDYIYLNHGGALSFTSGNYTILVWNRDNVNPSSSYGGIITNDDAGDNAWKIFKDVNQSRYRARSNSSQFDFPNYTAGQFQMYAFTFNAGTVTLYLDGSQTSQHTGISNPVGYSNIAWGSYRYGDAVIGQYRHPQPIGPTLLYNRALSSAEILQNYNVLKGRYGL